MNMTVRTTVLGSVTACFLLVSGLLPAQGSGKPILVINEDNSHFFGSRQKEQMNLEGCISSSISTRTRP